MNTRDFGTPRSRRLLGAGLWLVALAAGPMYAQESLPRITLAGTGLVSFNINGETPFRAGLTRDTDFGTVNDFSDSFLLIRLDRQLYDRDRAGMVIGFLFPDAENDLGDVFYNQVNVFYNSRNFAGTLGRTRLSNFLLEFPTLREEDILEYAFVTNAFSNADNSEFSRYGNILRAQVFRLNSRLVLSGQVSNWTVTDGQGAKADDFDVNAFSGSLVYRLPEAIRYSAFVRRVGIGLFSQNVDLPGQNWMTAIAAATALNLTRHPLRNFELRAQAIYNSGVDDLEQVDPRLGTLATPRGRARSEYFTLVGSLRFLSRPYQLDRFQAGITGTYKRFPDQDAAQFAIVPNLFFRLGQGVDLGVQYQFEQFDDTLAELVGRKREQSVKLTFSFRFQTMFNNYFGERDDILNMEHGYIP
jgi:hypothetical protein